MKKYFIYLTVLALCVSSCCNSDKKSSKSITVAEIISNNLRFNEGNLFVGDKLYISNFGGEQLMPINSNGAGYITLYDNGVMSTAITASGNLNAPKGMAEKDGYLYVSDVSTMVVYNRNDTAVAPLKLALPEGNIFANDIAIDGNNLYLTVTNSGKVFVCDISNPLSLSSDALKEYTSVVGANGIVIEGGKMYVASYPADGNTMEDNVIYVINDIANPSPEKLITTQGQYDGLALSADGTKLYFTNWIGGQVGYVDLSDKSVNHLLIDGYEFAGPAEISYREGKLYVCDLPNSKIIVLNVE